MCRHTRRDIIRNQVKRGKMRMALEEYMMTKKVEMVLSCETEVLRRQ